MLTKLKAASIGEVLDVVRALRVSWNPRRGEEELWFRGADGPHSLLPSLYRTRGRSSGYDEVTLFEAFKATGAPLAPSTVVDDWDWYFLARHHGIATRLLDWSTNVLAALFFAIEPHVRGKTRHQIDALAVAPIIKASYSVGSPVLWVLEARTLNAWSATERALIAIGDDLDSMLPSLLLDVRRRPNTWPNRNPLAIIPKHSNARIVAQGGRFTLHGRERTSIDGIGKRERGVKLACIALSEPHIARMWDDLDTAGINTSTIMKDLDSLAVYLKHTFDQSRRV